MGDKMSMSKKDLIYLADCIKADREHFSDIALDVLIGFCKTTNPRFMEDRWLGYIRGENGPNGGKVK